MNIQKIAIGGHLYALVPFGLLVPKRRTYENLERMAHDMGFTGFPLRNAELHVQVTETIRRGNPFLTHLALGQSFPYLAPEKDADDEEGLTVLCFSMIIYGEEDGTGEESRPPGTGRAVMQIQILPADLPLDEKFDTALCVFRA
jgi:hypothetical protein